MPGPTAEECAQFGLTLEEAMEASRSEVWPENLLAVNVFIAMSTQWRSAGFGATGLDYGPLPFVMRTYGVKRGEAGDVFESVRVLEDAALETMRRKKNG